MTVVYLVLWNTTRHMLELPRKQNNGYIWELNTVYSVCAFFPSPNRPLAHPHALALAGCEHHRPWRQNFRFLKVYMHAMYTISQRLCARWYLLWFLTNAAATTICWSNRSLDLQHFQHWHHVENFWMVGNIFDRTKFDTNKGQQETLTMPWALYIHNNTINRRHTICKLLKHKLHSRKC